MTRADQTVSVRERTERAARSDSERYYSRNADELLQRYEAVDFETVHADLLPYLPKPPAWALDVGAGSGRDAAWLSAHGWSVVAVEPNVALRAGARRIHRRTSIEWMDDRLPQLSSIQNMGRRFDLVLLSAVWMHVAPTMELTALTALANLSAEGAIVSLSVRMGGNETERGFYSPDMERLKRLAGEVGFEVVTERMNDDLFNRGTVAWSRVIFRRQ